MALADVAYFLDRGYRLGVEFKADDGSWVDFNAPFPSSPPDYWRGLLSEPSITTRSEDTSGIYVPAVDSIVMDNAPWQGQKYGFWDAPTPVTVRGKTFSGWHRRRVRLVLEIYDAGGSLFDSATVATCLVESIQRSAWKATVRLSSVARLLQTREADTLKVGSDWARGWPIAALIRMIVKRTDATIEFASGFGSTLTDLGTFNVPRCSSWGSAPGILNTGEPAVQHWIPRCFCPDPLNDDGVFVGFECPGSSDVSDGAVARFRLSTGQWTIWVAPASLAGQWPVSLWTDGGALYLFTIGDFAPLDYQFYTQRYLRTSGSTPGGVLTSLQAHNGYWPARETIRKGSNAAFAYLPNVGRPDGDSTACFGEAPMIPFPQAVDALFTDVTGRAADKQGRWTSFRQGDAIGAPTETNVVFPGTLRAGAAYLYASATDLAAAPEGFFRYFMGLQYHQPYRAQRPAGKFVQFIQLQADTKNYQLGIYPINTGSAIFRNLSAVLGSSGSQLWAQQITAWAPDPHSLSTDTQERVLLAICEWDDSYSAASRRWSRTRLLAVRFQGSDTALTTELVIDNPTDGTEPDFARVVVALWTPYANSTGTPDDPGETLDYAVGCLFNRATLQKPAYGLAVWKRATNATLSVLAAYGTAGYQGPTSSMPFGGFVRDATDPLSFRVVDQATGQVWKGTLNIAQTSVTWSMDNKGIPAHATEYCVASQNAGVATLDSQPAYLWGMAPGPTGEVSRGYPLRDGARPSWVRRVPGLYPIVQLSTKVADAVEVADFSGLKAWDAIKQLKQLAPGMTLYIDGDGKLHFEARTEGTSQGFLQPVDLAGNVSLATAYPVDPGFSVTLGTDLVRNAIDVTPWGLLDKGTSESSPIQAGGSTWAGEWIYDVRTEVPLNVAITCKSGGDVWAAGAATDPEKCAVLFRWMRLAETQHLWLSAQTSTGDTHARVSGLTIRGGDGTTAQEIYSGEVLIRSGDLLRVADGTLRRITGVIATADGYVDFSLDGAVDVAASAYSEVTISPQESRVMSDSQTGITTLAVAYASGTTISVVDGTAINVDSVIGVRTSLFHVTAKKFANDARTDLTVAQLFASTIPDASYPVAEPVQAYVYIREVDKLYPVGDTGVQFGVRVDENTELAADRCVSPGDGVAISAPGLKLAALKQATIRTVNKQSIGSTTTGDGYGRRDLSISDNRFVDPIKAELIGETTLEELAWPRTLVSGLRMDLFPYLPPNSTVVVQDPRITPVSSAGAEQAEAYEVTECKYSIGTGKQTLTLRSFDPPTTRSRSAETATGGTILPRGERGEGL